MYDILCLLLSLNILFSRFIHVAAWIVLLSFLLPRNIWILCLSGYTFYISMDYSFGSYEQGCPDLVNTSVCVAIGFQFS